MRESIKLLLSSAFFLETAWWRGYKPFCKNQRQRSFIQLFQWLLYECLFRQYCSLSYWCVCVKGFSICGYATCRKCYCHSWRKKVYNRRVLNWQRNFCCVVFHRYEIRANVLFFQCCKLNECLIRFVKHFLLSSHILWTYLGHHILYSIWPILLFV